MCGYISKNYNRCEQTGVENINIKVVGLPILSNLLLD